MCEHLLFRVCVDIYYPEYVINQTSILQHYKGLDGGILGLKV